MLLTVGATGYIGQPLHLKACQVLSGLGTSSTGSDDLIPFRLELPYEFDFGVINLGDTIFLTAAISAPDICAREQDRSRAVNVMGTKYFIEQVISRGGRVIFFSSDTVYGEYDNFFSEGLRSNPSGEYAHMKAEVERIFLGEPLFKTVRLSYVFSREDKFTKYLLGCANRGEEAELFHPFYRAIVHRNDIVDGALALAMRWDEFPQPVINFGGPEILSRVDFAEHLKRAFLPNLRYRITEPDDQFFRNRPRVIAMTSKTLPDLLNRPSRTLADSIRIEFNL